MIRQCLQKKAKKAIQANTELILKLQLRKSFSEENISFIPKSKHITCNFKKNFTKFMVFKDLNLESKAMSTSHIFVRQRLLVIKRLNQDSNDIRTGFDCVGARLL